MSGLIRVAIIVILALLLYRFVKRWLNTLEQNKQKNAPSTKGKVENMVRCEFCEVHLPQNEAIRHNGRWYCSEQHYRQSKQQP